MTDPMRAHAARERRRDLCKATCAVMKLAVALVLFAACSATEDRPETLAFITETILAPSCGTTECHSSMVMRQGYAFDTVAAAQVSLAKNLIATCTVPP